MYVIKKKCWLEFLESSSILSVLKKKQESELMNESNDIDRAFNPFKKKNGGQANISFSTLSPLDQVNYFLFYRIYFNIV